MPTYEYRCKDCGHTFDAYQAFTDDALTECPECAGSLKKLFGNVGISFKGSGFYKNDSRTSGAGPAKTPAEGASTSKDTASSDSSSTSSSSDSSGPSTPAPAKKETPKKESSSSPAST